MKIKPLKTIIFTYGLPASGKSFYAIGKDIVIDFDKISKKCKDYQSCLEQLGEKLKSHFVPYYAKEAIVDGLFTTNDQLRKAFDYLKVELDDFDLTFKVIYWEEDRETCLYNDKGRRKLSSEVSIKNLPFEKPDIAILPELNKPNFIMKMKVVRKPQIISMLNDKEYNIDFKTMMLYSGEWSGGGTYGNCYDDNKGTIEAGQPLDFEELDNILLDICPNISFLMHKKIMRECCSIETKYTSDYYGGGSSYLRHACDIKKLSDCLISLKLIKEEV